MKYTTTSREKESMVEFETLKEGEVFCFFEPDSISSANHSIYMKVKNPSSNTILVNIVDLSDGKLFSFSEKKRNTINDPDEKRGDKVYKLNSKINITL